MPRKKRTPHERLVEGRAGSPMEKEAYHREDGRRGGVSTPLGRVVPDRTVDFPKVLGHEVSFAEWRYFELWLRMKTGPEALAILHQEGFEHVTGRQLDHWRNSRWWPELYNLFVRDRASQLHAYLSEEVGDIKDSFLAIVKGERPDDRSTSAAARLIETFLKLGDKPVLKQGSQVNVAVNTQVNNFGGVDMARMRRELPPERIREISITGDIPEEYRITEEGPA